MDRFGRFVHGIGELGGAHIADGGGGGGVLSCWKYGNFGKMFFFAVSEVFRKFKFVTFSVSNEKN